jgi:hypothetical protein
MNRNFPDQIVHYNRAKPFRSITSTPLDQFSSVASLLNETNSWGLNRFKDQTYFQQRLEVEARLHQMFAARGGRPMLRHPIYFFLGRNPHFEEHPLNVGYAIDLSHLDRTQVSFSYGDTMFSMDEENRKVAGKLYENPLCNQLFVLDELEELFASPLFPDESALPIEAHLWIQPIPETVQKLARAIPASSSR